MREDVESRLRVDDRKCIFCKPGKVFADLVRRCWKRGGKGAEVRAEGG